MELKFNLSDMNNMRKQILILMSALIVFWGVSGFLSAPASEKIPVTDGLQQTCPLAPYQHVMGKTKAEATVLMAEIPKAQQAETIRVICHMCAVTMDFSPTRLNIILDKDDRVTRLKCG